MGTVYRKTITRPRPEGAETFTRTVKGADGAKRSEVWARWKDSKGRTRTARITDNGRVSIEANTYTAKYRDGQGIVREISTGCRDKGAAQSMLSDLMKRAEKVRAGVVSAAEDGIADFRAMPLELHFAEYLTHLEVKGATAGQVESAERYLRDMAKECGFDTLAR